MMILIYFASIIPRRSRKQARSLSPQTIPIDTGTVNQTLPSRAVLDLFSGFGPIKCAACQSLNEEGVVYVAILVHGVLTHQFH